VYWHSGDANLCALLQVKSEDLKVCLMEAEKKLFVVCNFTASCVLFEQNVSMSDRVARWYIFILVYPNFGIFWNEFFFIFLMIIWYYLWALHSLILWLFVSDHLFFLNFGILYQEKSGNPGSQALGSRRMPPGRCPW
jgi:hypothetical protein